MGRGLHSGVEHRLFIDCASDSPGNKTRSDLLSANLQLSALNVIIHIRINLLLYVVQLCFACF